MARIITTKPTVGRLPGPARWTDIPRLPWKPANVLDVPSVGANQLDYSVSGLGAYRSYRSHPGRYLPMIALTLREDSDADVQRQHERALKAGLKSPKIQDET